MSHEDSVMQPEEHLPSYRGYMPELDGLRGAAILGVLAYHGLDGRCSYEHFSGLARVIVYVSKWGASGVHLFFVLSGFLITGILVDSVGRPNYYQLFYLKRALRILPAYLLILVFLTAFHVISLRYLIACILYIANMAHLIGADASEYGSFWSLAVEEQFYLLWPVITRRYSLSTLRTGIVCYLLLSIAIRFIMQFTHPQVVGYFKLWANAEWLLAGAFIAISLRSGVLPQGRIRRFAYILTTFGFLIIVLKSLSDLSHFGGRVGYVLTTSLVPFSTLSFFSGLVLFVVRRNRRVQHARRPAMLRVLVFFAYISYGLYLVHPLIFSETDALWQGSMWFTTQMPFSVLITLWISGMLVSVLIAYISRRYFEQFFLNLNRTASPSIK